MIVKDIMNVNVIMIKPSATVKEAASEMTKHHIGSLVVISAEGEALGIITERDILSHVVAEGRHGEEIKVEEIMTKELITVTPEDTLEEAAAIMSSKRIKKLPVIEENKIVGIITASDLISFEKQLVEKLSELMVSPEVRKIGG